MAGDALALLIIGRRWDTADKLEASPAQLIDQVFGTNGRQIQFCEPRQPPTTSYCHSEGCDNLRVGSVAARIGEKGPLLHG